MGGDGLSGKDHRRPRKTVAMDEPKRLTRLSRSVSGHRVLVTGAGSGIGRSTAHLFADEGALVAVTDLDGEQANTVAAEITSSGAEARAWKLDVADPEAVDRVVAEVATQLGGIDVLVNNAGVAATAPIDDQGFSEAWVAALDVNLTAMTSTIRAALPFLRESVAGRIVNVSSVLGAGGSSSAAAYTAAKHGVVGLTRALAVELGETGLTVNAVGPGPIDTGMTALIPDEAKRKFARRRVPMRRYAEPEEVAHAILHLAIPASSYVNGHLLMVDGGMTVKND